MTGKSTLDVIYAGRVSYEQGLALQETFAARRIGGDIPDTAIVLEHPPVITLGHRGDRGHVLASPEYLEQRGIAVHRVNRGGDVTYHGPGQVVLYPIVNLHDARLGQARFVEILEESMIRAVAQYDVLAVRIPKKRGIFVGQKKIGAVGIHVSRGVTTHGLALNVAPNLDHFELIVPCGLHDHSVTSLQRESSSRESIDQHQVEVSLVNHLAQLLQLDVRVLSWDQ